MGGGAPDTDMDPSSGLQLMIMEMCAGVQVKLGVMINSSSPNLLWGTAVLQMYHLYRVTEPGVRFPVVISGICSCHRIAFWEVYKYVPWETRRPPSHQGPFLTTAGEQRWKVFTNDHVHGGKYCHMQKIAAEIPPGLRPHQRGHWRHDRLGCTSTWASVLGLPSLHST